VSAPTEWPAWQRLAAAAAQRTATLSALFERDAGRSERLTRSACGITVDAGKTHLEPGIEADLHELARTADVAGWRARMLAGEPVNATEGRAALHVALRLSGFDEVRVDGEAVGGVAAEARRRMAELADAVRAGTLRSADGAAFTDVVHIGIGGSELGPRLVCDALADTRVADGPRIHFVANLDPAERGRVLAGLDPARTLFVVVSKTFTTLETLANARSCRNWLAARAGADAPAAQFVGITAAPERARAFGVAAERILPLPSWVGGRYSLWSAVGLPIALAFGNAAFDELLAGAAAMDRHFRDARDEDSLPLLLALVGVWYRNFDRRDSHVVIPYASGLARLPDYLQQLEMESNGKRVDRDGRVVDYATAPAVWGAAGTNAQHAFFQWLHQGDARVASDFIAVRPPAGDDGDRTALAANCFAQSAALMTGCDPAVPCPGGVESAEAVHRAMPGDRPSTTLLLDDAEPATLGALIALYEHKVFCQAMIWRINPFDQWGVERGKELARALKPVLEGAAAAGWDGSTRSLVARCRGAT